MTRTCIRERPRWILSDRPQEAAVLPPAGMQVVIERADTTIYEGDPCSRTPPLQPRRTRPIPISPPSKPSNDSPVTSTLPARVIHQPAGLHRMARRRRPGGRGCPIQGPVGTGTLGEWEPSARSSKSGPADAGCGMSSTPPASGQRGFGSSRRALARSSVTGAEWDQRHRG